MRKLFLVLTAVVALTAASKAMVVYAQDAAPEAMTETVSNEVANEVMGNEVMSNEVMSNEVMSNEAGAVEAGTTY
jgi:hypothetical protein